MFQYITVANSNWMLNPASIKLEIVSVIFMAIIDRTAFLFSVTMKDGSIQPMCPCCTQVGDYHAIIGRLLLERKKFDGEVLWCTFPENQKGPRKNPECTDKIKLDTYLFDPKVPVESQRDAVGIPCRYASFQEFQRLLRAFQERKPWHVLREHMGTGSLTLV